ncbi:choice-of-anchor D domain-containing protein [Burkholderia ubonensis]|uniref:choice-of-anchor D domain-containing protein n=1 Tax=Burkholderia ubonensis TaxID=101571 RepID=UPI00075C88E0|nr:choice-of-anchor D domain-containing protein [Burkholderia ubonensis]KVP39925.1 hypothetical protein WJ87_07005 [Burkholderia ubonensis]
MNLKKLILVVALSALGTVASAASYHIVVPMPGKSTAGSDSNVDGPVLSSSQLSFGARQRGDATLPLILTLSNPGTKPLTVAQMTVPDNGAADGFSVQHYCAVLAPSATCQAYVYYRPIVAGAHASALTIEHDGKRHVTLVPLSGSARDPSASLTIPQFGLVNVGSAKDRVAVFTNTGLGIISVGTPAVTGAGYSVVASDCPSPLAPMASCNITTRFTAQKAGDQSGVLSVPSGAGTVTADLAGQGASSDLQFTSGPVAAFGGVTVGASAVSKTVTLKNSGNLAADNLSLKIDGAKGYAIQSSTCGSSLAAGQTCTFAVKFAPDAPGAQLGDLQAMSGDKVLASSPLSGVGTTAAILLSAHTTITYAVVGTTVVEYYVFTNSSGSPVTINNKSLSFPDPALTYAFGPGTDNCGTVVPAMTSCRVNYTLQAADMFGGKPLTLTLDTSAGKISANSQQVAGSWAKLTPSPANPAFNFGNVVLGSAATSSRVTVTDPSYSQVLSDISYSLPEGFELVDNTCGATTERGSVCEFAVKFSPKAAKAYKGNFTMTARTRDAGTGTPQPYTLTIPLSGTGTAPATISWQVDTSEVVEKGESRTLSVTLYNPGSTSVTLGAVGLTGNTSEFSLKSSTCTSSLAAQSSCTASVDFAPNGTGARPVATLSVLADGMPVTKALSASAGVAVLTATPSALTLPSRYAQNSANVFDAFVDTKVTITNTGTAAAEHLGSGFTYNTGKLAFSLQWNSCVNRLNAGSSCVTTVRALGSIIGNHTGSVDFSSASGSLKLPFTFSIVPMDIDVATVKGVQDTVVGKGSVSNYTITTNSTGKIIVETPTITGNTGEYSLASGSNCSGIIGVNATCNINVLFTPTAVGTRPPGTLSVKVGGVMRTVPLNGNGIAP